MTGYDAEVLANQLAALGRDLQSEVIILGELEEAAVDAEGLYRKLDEDYQDRFAEAFLALDGSVEVRKSGARLKAVPARLITQDAWLEWSRYKAKVRTQQANLSALHRRCEIGRSLLSRERALLNLSASGVDAL